LVFNLEHFAEHNEDLELGMQLASLGIFNPKLLSQVVVTNVNSEILLNINEILIISHIPREIKTLPVYEILPYPVENNKILQDNTPNKYYVYRNSLYNKETKKPVTNACLLGLVNQTDTSTQNRY